MSWKGSGSFRGGSGSSRPSSSGGPSSIWDAGSAGGPSLLALIIAACVTGVVMLFLAIAFGGAWGQQTAAPAQPAAAAQPTARPAATAAPAAAAQPTAAPAAGGAAAIPTAPIGPALASGTGEAVSLESEGDTTRFRVGEITVPNGLVTLTFANTGIAVQHNWVLVDGGDDVAAAANDAAAAAAASARNAAAAVPPADTPGLLVATQQLNPGESVEVTFETPGPGTYTFLCTFPGHYAGGMVGQLIVE
jgi:uncharacterized cupredoxin-like copper-binding protein